ncbi:MAG: fumarylacetoacetate hydrolase family protein, partial [Gammaproteobacteria bacterium]|nr:fumarylacetoacetate hydrolase family protein [Gammaproteobacteria bacterium]
QNPPVFFSKPADAIVTDNAPVRYPPATNNLHHEVELVVALDRGGRNITVDEAHQCVFGYAVGIDFTRRDLQAQAKQKGKPWDAAKGFDQSAPVSAINPVADGKHPQQGRIALRINDELRQDADLSDMIWSVPEIIYELSRYFELQAGDLIFTGTPAGVSAVIAGDHLQAEIEAVGEVDFQLVSE